MRLGEILVLVSAIGLIVWRFNRADQQRMVNLSFGGLLLAALIFHLGIEGERWQMWPAYAFAAGVLIIGLIGLRRTVDVQSPVWRRGLRISISLGLALIATALPVLLPVFVLPAPTGPHAVGVHDFALTDSSREDADAPDPKTKREIMIRAWYPISDVRNPVVPMLSGKLAAEVSKVFSPIPGVAMMSHLTLIPTHSHLDAPVLSGTDKLPVVIFSPGLYSFVAQNTSLMEELASNGCVVLSIGHPYTAAALEFPDGRVVTKGALPKYKDIDHFIALSKVSMQAPTLKERRNALIEMGNQDPLRPVLQVWVDDTEFVIDMIDRAQTVTEFAFLNDRMDENRIAVTGMSFGGATAAQVCYKDPRCKVGVNLDGSEYANLLGKALPVPFLMEYDEQNIWKGRGNNDLFYDDPMNLQSSKVERIILKGTAHSDMSDATQLALPLLKPYVGLGSDDGAVIIHVLDTVTPRFINQVLLARPLPANGLLDGVPGVYPQDYRAALADRVQ